jgi:hypothetical protein
MFGLYDRKDALGIASCHDSLIQLGLHRQGLETRRDDWLDP